MSALQRSGQVDLLWPECLQKVQKLGAFLQVMKTLSPSISIILGILARRESISESVTSKVMAHLSEQ